MMHGIRTDLAMERAGGIQGAGDGVTVERKQHGQMETTWVYISNAAAAERLGKSQGAYWTLMHRNLPLLEPEERMEVAMQVADALRGMLPAKGDVLVLGLGNRRMTADALGSRTVEGVLVTRHFKEPELRGVCALSPGVMGVTGIETAELAAGLTERLRPAAVIVVDALAAMETSHIGTTIQVTDTGICPGGGVGNHRKGITQKTLRVPVIAMGIPMVVYASTIVRDALRRLLANENEKTGAEAIADQLTEQIESDLVVTPRNIDEMVQGLGDMLALSINAALHPAFGVEELSRYLH